MRYLPRYAHALHILGTLSSIAAKLSTALRYLGTDQVLFKGSQSCEVGISGRGSRGQGVSAVMLSDRSPRVPN